MRVCCCLVLMAGVGVLLYEPLSADSACCYFSAKDKDILQPSQKVFITWDPEKKLESFTVQPRFEGNAQDFGMVIPTPARPKLDESPRDFFKELAVFTILKRRDYPHSKLPIYMYSMNGMAMMGGGMMGMGGGMMGGGMGGGFGLMPGNPAPPVKPPVTVLETGVVGSLDYKILSAERADDLYRWLRDHKYQFSGDEAALDHYIKKKWFFTVMRIDTMQMKRNPDGTFAGDVTPTRFQFTTSELVYPLKITQISVKAKTEALFYVQAPYKVDLAGDNTFQFQWVPLLEGAQGCCPPGTYGTARLPGKGDDWLEAIKDQKSELMQKATALGFTFVRAQRPGANDQGRIPTTLEWAKKLTIDDVRVLQGQLPYSEQVPNVDLGFSMNDFRDQRRGRQVATVIQSRLNHFTKERPGGFLVRDAPEKDVRNLRILAGHLQAGQFVTKFRKTFTKAEMDDDLLIVPAVVGKAKDVSEYEEQLPTSPP